MSSSNNETPEILYNVPPHTLKPDSVFWSENPNILFHRDMIFELFPIDSMGYNQKLNAISRAIILLTIVSFLFTRSIRILVIGGITLAAIYLLYSYKNAEMKKKESKTPEKIKETFENPALAVINKYQTDPHTFDKPSETNPFSNVLIPDYDFNPNKKPAPPAFNENTNQSILENAKKLVQQANPGQPDIADKLFKDLGEQFIFEQSLQPFYSNPGTTIPNDQAGFADFCYGSMVSCKEGNLFACARNLDRYTN
jgi:hypothetical protein